MVLGVKEAVRAACLELRVNVVSVPLYNIILVFLRELMQRVDLVLDDLFARADFHVVDPGRRDVMRFDIRPLEETVMDCVRPGPSVPDGKDAEYDQPDDNIDSCNDDLALAQDKMPDRGTKVLRHAKAPLDADGHQTAAASMY